MCVSTAKETALDCTGMPVLSAHARNTTTPGHSQYDFRGGFVQLQEQMLVLCCFVVVNTFVPNLSLRHSGDADFRVVRCEEGCTLYGKLFHCSRPLYAFVGCCSANSPPHTPRMLRARPEQAREKRTRVQPFSKQIASKVGHSLARTYIPGDARVLFPNTIQGNTLHVCRSPLRSRRPPYVCIGKAGRCTTE